MDLENGMQQKCYPDRGQGSQVILVHDAINIAKQYARERYHQAQYDLIVMITQDMFNACSLNLPLEYVGNLKKQLKSKLTTETEK